VTKPIELESQHLEFSAAADLMNCGVVGRDLAGLVLFANERLLSWLGYARDEVIGKTMEKFIPEELGIVVHEEMRGIEGGDIRSRITILKRKDSTTFPVLLIPNQYAGPEGPFFNVVIELASVQTAKMVSYGGGNNLRSSLERIALELQTIGMASSVTGAPVIPLNHPDLDALSDREREVLVLLVAGKRVQRISDELFISPHTVRNHLKSIYRQLGVGNQSELIEHVRALDASPKPESESN
jgi:PAS domain S-box-containing protein